MTATTHAWYRVTTPDGTVRTYERLADAHHACGPYDVCSWAEDEIRARTPATHGAGHLAWVVMVGGEYLAAGGVAVSRVEEATCHATEAQAAAVAEAYPDAYIARVNVNPNQCL